MADISRRDFVNGMLVGTSASMLPMSITSQAAMAALDPSYYPPAMTGLRGSQPGSETAAHQRAWNGRSDWGQVTDLSEEYDLVVVGAGISGLSAAFFYQQQHGPGRKVLVLDNHDDFGGHARRNEHSVDGTTLLGEGGSESFEGTADFSEVVSKLLDDLGVDMDSFDEAYDEGFFERHGLGAVTYFNERTYGEDKLVRHPFGDYPGFVQGLMRPTLSIPEAVAQAPLDEEGKTQLLRLMQSGPQSLPVSSADLKTYLRETSYLDFLRKTLAIDDPGILKMARNSVIDYAGYGAEAMSVRGALGSGALGMNPLGDWKELMLETGYQRYIDPEGPTYRVEDPFIHHFPDGNATITRSLVKKLIPQVGPGDDAVSIITSRFDYGALDEPGNSCRLRLNSTVVNARHDGDPANSESVSIQYVQGGKAYRVKARGVVMAGYNMMIPRIVDDLPAEQDAALRKLNKVCLQYSTVGLRNWRAMKEVGIGMAMSPGNMHQAVGMDFPVSMGRYEFTRSPDDPCVLHMRCVPMADTMGQPVPEQVRAARQMMLGMNFADYEAEIREHLTGMLPSDSFNFDRDVASISTNRWGHGYIYGSPGKVGRQRFGRITIANSDAAGGSLFQNAVDQAWRAVQELG